MARQRRPDTSPAAQPQTPCPGPHGQEQRAHQGPPDAGPQGFQGTVLTLSVYLGMIFYSNPGVSQDSHVAVPWDTKQGPKLWLWELG